jgi:hypothetical protein
MKAKVEVFFIWRGIDAELIRYLRHIGDGLFPDRVPGFTIKLKNNGLYA